MEQVVAATVASAAPIVAEEPVEVFFRAELFGAGAELEGRGTVAVVLTVGGQWRL